MSTVIVICANEKCCGNEICVCANDGERGPQGAQGEQGEQGAQGERGYSIANATISELDEHLILRREDGAEIDAGEIPKCVAKVAMTATLDGTTKVFPLDTTVISPNLVSYLVINGVTYLDGWSISDGRLTLDFEDDEIPTGKMYVLTNSPSLIDGVEAPSIPQPEIIAILGED